MTSQSSETYFGMLERRMQVNLNHLCSFPRAAAAVTAPWVVVMVALWGSWHSSSPAPSRGPSQGDTAPAALEGCSHGRDGEEEAVETSVTPRVLLLCSQARLPARVISYGGVAVVNYGCRAGWLMVLMPCSWCLRGQLQLSVLICAVWGLPTWLNALQKLQLSEMKWKMD